MLSPLHVWQLKMSSFADVCVVKYMSWSVSELVNYSLRNIYILCFMK